MKQATSFIETEPVASPADALTEVLRSGAQRMLTAALESEVSSYLAQHTDARDEAGHKLVVRNGHCPERTIQTGLGSVEVRRPRVDDRRVDEDGRRIQFTSSILPPYLRRTKSLEELIPWLYLKGISTGDFSEALSSLLGTNAPGLAASTVVRLKQVWETECEEWRRRDLTGKEYVYVWVDGIHFNIRLEEHRQCILVVMGATADGKKERLVIQDGYRENEQSWKELLLDLKARGLTRDPELVIGDGALGFWKALPQVWPKARAQRCWCHKTANVMNKLPKRMQPRAKDALHQIWMAPTMEDANRAFDLFVHGSPVIPDATPGIVNTAYSFIVLSTGPGAASRAVRKIVAEGPGAVVPPTVTVNFFTTMESTVAGALTRTASNRPFETYTFGLNGDAMYADLVTNTNVIQYETNGWHVLETLAPYSDFDIGYVGGITCANSGEITVKTTAMSEPAHASLAVDYSF